MSAAGALLANMPARLSANRSSPVAAAKRRDAARLLVFVESRNSPNWIRRPNVGERAAQRVLAPSWCPQGQNLPGSGCLRSGDGGIAVCAIWLRRMSGYSLYKGASFLAGKLGTEDRLGVHDGDRRWHHSGGASARGHLTPKGCRSGKKLSSKRAELQSYLLDTYSGKKFGMPSTGNASRSVGEAPGVSPANFYLAPGKRTPEQIIGTDKKQDSTSPK